jgi:hypothetical protein
MLIPSVDSSVDPSRSDIPEVYALHVSAIVYADGSSEVSKQDIETIKGQNLGFALEFKRDADLLAASETSGIPTSADLDDLTKKIGAVAPRSAEDSAASVRGISLTGVPQAYIDACIGLCFSGLRGGINAAREQVLRDLDRVWLTSDPSSQSIQANRAREGHNLPLSLSDISQKYRALSVKQIQFLKVSTARVPQ